MTGQSNWGEDTTSGSMIPPPPPKPKQAPTKPLHPRATQGIAVMIAGIVLGVAGAVIYAGLDLDGGRYSSGDSPAVAYGLFATGGFLLLAGVIVYAASPARVDWEPPEVLLMEWRQGKR